MAMRIIFSMFWCAIFVFRVNFVKYSLAWQMAHPQVISGVPHLHRGGRLAYMCAPGDAHMMSLHMQ